MLQIKFQSLLKKYSNQPEAVRFIINGILLALLWILFYGVLKHKPFIHEFYEVGVSQFTYFLTQATRIFLELFGYEATTYGKIVKIVGTPGVYLDRGCLARNLMGLYAGFILAYPGKTGHKLWYLPMGLALITILNIIRLGGMAMTIKCCPEYVDFNHHYAFKVVVFGFIFLLWYIWVFKKRS